MAFSSGSNQASVQNERRALVVDDDETFAESLAAVFEDAGFEVRVAHSASEGLGMLDTFVPDVAIVDIRMPVVDGHALLAIFRAEPRLRNCTFVGMSGHTSVELDTSKFDHFFRKPIDSGAVLAVLGQAH